jgi:hypothetical protein
VPDARLSGAVPALQNKLRAARRDLAATQREAAGLAAQLDASHGAARTRADEHSALLDRLRQAQDARARSEASLCALSAEASATAVASSDAAAGAEESAQRALLAAKATELDALRERLAASAAEDEEARRALADEVERLEGAPPPRITARRPRWQGSSARRVTHSTRQRRGPAGFWQSFRRRRLARRRAARTPKRSRPRRRGYRRSSAWRAMGGVRRARCVLRLRRSAARRA